MLIYFNGNPAIPIYSGKRLPSILIYVISKTIVIKLLFSLKFLMIMTRLLFAIRVIQPIPSLQGAEKMTNNSKSTIAKTVYPTKHLREM